MAQGHIKAFLLKKLRFLGDVFFEDANVEIFVTFSKYKYICSSFYN